MAPLRRAVASAAVLLACASPLRAQTPGGPVDNWRDLGPALRACWQPPPGTEGSEITLRFGLTHTGALRGAPIVTYSKLLGDPGLRKAFALSALAGLAACTPVALTPAFGRIASQRTLTMRFVHSGRRQRPIGA